MAQFDLGLEYYLKNNFEEAARWLKKAVNQGDANAQFILGMMCVDGEGVKKDLKKGVSLIQKAADQGDAEAIKVFALCSSPPAPHVP